MLLGVESKDPNNISMELIEARAIELVREAGRMAMDRFRCPLRVEFKQEGRSDPVTDADREIESFLRGAIERDFPNHAVLGEEGTEIETGAHEWLWVLDPIDGTNNFLNGLPIFACSAALLRWGEPVVGAIFLPVAPRASLLQPAEGGGGGPVAGFGTAILHARLGGGAHLDGAGVRASEALRPEHSTLVGFPANHAHQFQRRGRLRAVPGEIRSLGSICYETALVACGVYSYAVFHRPKLWDVAAGAVLVREAGGRSLQWAGDRWQPLTRFEPMPNRKQPAQRGLRFWGAPILFGGPRVADFVAEHLQPAPPRRS